MPMLSILESTILQWQGGRIFACTNWVEEVCTRGKNVQKGQAHEEIDLIQEDFFWWAGWLFQIKTRVLHNEQFSSTVGG